MMSITPEVIAEIRARHEELEQRGHLAYHDWASEAHADRATLLKALDAERQRREEVGRLREALTEARVWHEAADKAISKQPNANQGHNGWNRLQHQEQIRLIDAALNQEPGQ